MLDVEHAARRHCEQSRLLDRFVGKRGRGDADRGDTTALQVNEVAHTARRARASIRESLDDGVGDAGYVVDQLERGWLGEDLLGLACRDSAVGPQVSLDPIEKFGAAVLPNVQQRDPQATELSQARRERHLWPDAVVERANIPGHRAATSAETICDPIPVHGPRTAE